MVSKRYFRAVAYLHMYCSISYSYRGLMTRHLSYNEYPSILQKDLAAAVYENRGVRLVAILQAGAPGP